MDTLTRGERNNNPCNLNYVYKQPFQGQLGIEDVPFGAHYSPRFSKFDSAQNGIRAGVKTIISYITKDGANTVRKIINRWAPSSENNTISYIYDVAKKSGIEPDSVVVVNTDNLKMLIVAIIVHENGQNIYSDETISLAIADAIVPSNPHGVRL